MTCNDFFRSVLGMNFYSCLHSRQNQLPGPFATNLFSLGFFGAPLISSTINNGSILVGLVHLVLLVLGYLGPLVVVQLELRDRARESGGFRE